MPTGHIAVDCFEFPEDGWKNPHECGEKPLGNLHTINAGIERSAFEIQPGDKTSQDIRDFPMSGPVCRPVDPGPNNVYYDSQSFRPKQAVLSLDWPLADFDPSTSLNVDSMLFDQLPRHLGKEERCNATCKSIAGGGCTERRTAFDHLFWG